MNTVKGINLSENNRRMALCGGNTPDYAFWVSMVIVNLYSRMTSPISGETCVLNDMPVYNC